MGVSISLLQKDFLELSIEVDRKVTIELSTGFIDRECTVHSAMSVTSEEIDLIIDQLTKFNKQYKQSWKCHHCGSFNAAEETLCYTCNQVRGSLINHTKS